MPIPTASCPQCTCNRVKPIMIWRMASADGSVQGPPQPMFACQELGCLHKWTRPPNAASDCTHTIQRLIDVSVGDSRPMGRYVCADCGTDVARRWSNPTSIE